MLFLGFPTYALSVVLASLLVASGLGSWLSARFEDTRRALVVALGAAVSLILLLALGLQPLLEAAIGLPFGARLVVAFVLIAPVGAALGMAMPLGLRRFRALYPTAIAYAWGVNGVASVLASATGIGIALSLGYRDASLAALACYAFALAHALRGRWARN